MDQETESDSEDDINNTVVWILIFCQSKYIFKYNHFADTEFAFPSYLWRWKLYGLRVRKCNMCFFCVSVSYKLRYAHDMQGYGRDLHTILHLQSAWLHHIMLFI